MQSLALMPPWQDDKFGSLTSLVFSYWSPKRSEKVSVSPPSTVCQWDLPMKSPKHCTSRTPACTIFSHHRKGAVRDWLQLAATQTAQHEVAKEQIVKENKHVCLLIVKSKTSQQAFAAFSASQQMGWQRSCQNRLERASLQLWDYPWNHRNPQRECQEARMICCIAARWFGYHHTSRTTTSSATEIIFEKAEIATE